jgi:hypothetical protein
MRGRRRARVKQGLEQPQSSKSRHAGQLDLTCGERVAREVGTVDDKDPQSGTSQQQSSGSASYPCTNNDHIEGHDCAPLELTGFRINVT